MGQILKPSKEELQPLLDEAIANQTPEEWVAKILAAYKMVLSKNPLRYRAYGPYWWLIKEEFIKNGDLTFGEHIDAEWVKKLTYGETSLNLVAAYAYEEARTAHVNTYDSTHQLEDVKGGAVQYIAADEHLEALAMTQVGQ